MHLLVLGGGGFLGYHVVAEALSAGHDVTVFSRESTPPADGVEVLVGDRTSDLSALHGRQFDAVLDTFSDPDAVADTATLLSGSAGAYGYISGMSVYDPAGPTVPGAGDPVRRPGGGAAVPGGDPLQARSLAKLAGERIVADRFDGPAPVFRVGVMVGPRDPSDRFTFWPVRLAAALSGAAGRTVLAPGDPDRVVQYTDARDIGAFVASALDRRLAGVYDTVGPGRAQPLSAVLDACLTAPGGGPGDVEWVWAGEAWLRDELAPGASAATPEEARPLWFPEDQIPQDAIDAASAIGEGMTFRPALDTARDVLAWARGESHDTVGDLLAGLSGDVEQDLLRRWRRVSGGVSPGG